MLHIIRKILKKLAAISETKVYDIIIKNINTTVVPPLYLWGFYIFVKFLKLPKSAVSFLNSTFVILFTFFAVLIIANVAKNVLMLYWEKKRERFEGINTRGITFIIELLIWTIGVIFLLDNLGLKISAVVTGLGIGGVAIALASQAILGDLFSYFVIFFDKPFEVGDFIVVDPMRGTVEKIGIKTTRIRSLDGEELIFSNTDLTTTRIQNYKRMERRRVPFSIGVVYETPLNHLREIPMIIEEIIQKIERATFDRAHFKSYADFSLVYEIVYYVNDGEYQTYMDIQQEINLQIFAEFQKRGIVFAYPTQLIYMNSDSGEKQV